MTVQIVSNNVTSPGFPATVIPEEPEVFQNADGTAAAINQDGSVNSAAHPAKAGSIVSIWATGTGPIYPRPLDGQIATTAQDYDCCQISMLGIAAIFLPSPPTPLPVVLYGGAAPGMVAGIVQINFQIPPDIDEPGLYGFVLLSNEVVLNASDLMPSGPFGIYLTP
jgi:uncharacterized protein (TIGR03437 family)